MIINAKSDEELTIRSAQINAIFEFAAVILHGDDKHRQWLLNAATAFVNGDQLPQPSDIPT